MQHQNKITNQEALALLKKFKRTNDQKILGELYQSYMRMVLGIGLKYFKDLSQAEDLVIDVYEILNKKIAHHDIKNVSSWIYSVAKNECLMRLRKKKHEYYSDDINFEAEAVESEQILHLFDDKTKEKELNKLQRCIEQLKQEQKSCISEFYLNSKTYKEIAASQQLTLKEVKSFIQNGKRNLKNCMDK